MELIYNKEANTWNVVADGVSTELLQMNNDGTAQMTLRTGDGNRTGMPLGWTKAGVQPRPSDE